MKEGEKGDNLKHFAVDAVLLCHCHLVGSGNN